MTLFDDKACGETVYYDGSLESGDGSRSTVLDVLTSSDLELVLLISLCLPEARMDKALGIEWHAIDRKIAYWKRPEECGLSLKQSLLVTMFACFTGDAASAYRATFGAAMGLHQSSVSPFGFGWYPNKLLPYSTVSNTCNSGGPCLSSGLASAAVADTHISLVIGIVIIDTISLAIGLISFGYMLLIIYMILFGMVGPYADDTTSSSIKRTDLSGSMLSLLVIIYGSSFSWCTIVSNSYFHYPADVSRLQAFVLTILSIAVPTSIGTCMSAGVIAAYRNPREGLGFLIRDMLHPRVFAKILLVLFSYTYINTNFMTLYSGAISFQQMAHPLAKIPRFIRKMFWFAIRLNTHLQNFLSLLGYWCTNYFVILMLEHILLRKHDRLPLGLAASVASLLGVVIWCMGIIEN
ncbi:hypothetical protein CI102_3105 [Trichoderma harzianum]|nr:hypothetical protein CI102_3105 [Trichoderma harzianum]